MAQDILITPGSGEPQILFRGSGTTDTTIDLNVISSQQSQSLSGSGTTTLSFEGTQGQLFSVTDNLSSGTIFSVSDITGLPLIEVDASGDVKIGEYGRYVGIGSGIAPGYGLDVFSSGHFHKGFILASYTPATTTNALYNVGGSLYFNSSAVGGGGSSYTAGSGLILADNKFHMSAAQTIITSLFATDIKIGEDNETKIDFETANEIHFYAGNIEQVYLANNIFGPESDSDVDLGSTSVRWKDAYVDSITVTGEVDGASLDISGDADIDGTTNLDAVDIDGNVQLDGTLTVGVDDTGYDVKLFGATASSYLEWDESEDRLNLVGGSYVNEAVPASDTGTGVTATITLDTSLGNYHNIVMGGGGGSPTQVRTINLNNAKRGQRFILRLTQHDTSPQTVTAWLNTGSDYVYYTGTTRATVRWAGGIKPTMSTSTSHTDVYGFLCTNNAGSAFDAFIIGQDLPD